MGYVNICAALCYEYSEGMKLTFTSPKGSAAVRFIEGSLSRFTGDELLVGTGEPKVLSSRKAILLMRKVVSLAKQNHIDSITIDWASLRSLVATEVSDVALGELAATAFVMADYEHITYKHAPKEGFAFVATVAITNPPKEAKAGFERGQIIAGEVNACRELANTPGGDMTPKTLSQAAKKALQGTKATHKVLGRAEMEKLGMGAILGIAKGSAHEPQFIVMEFWGAGKQIKKNSPSTSSGPLKPLVLVGKGVTFDTGGLNIKTGDNMYEMHLDMSGGAAVIHTIALIAKLKLKVNVVGLVPAVENNLGGEAVRPGDILRSLSGKTIEVLNTDAEGRIILADGITYAKKYDPKMVVDVATLTGASLIALGTQASAFMTNDETKITSIMNLAEKSGDYLWPFPAWEEYEAMTKGTFADIPNISTDGNSRYGGVIAGGMFLKVFAKDLDCLWIHIDMAPRMTATSGEHLAKGAVGAPVRFLLTLIENGVE